MSDLLQLALTHRGDWKRAFREWLRNPDFYACRERPLTERFPWDHFEVGTKRERLETDPKREEEMRRLFHELGGRIHLAHFKDLKLNPTGQSVDLPGPGGGDMNYALLISQIRKLGRPLPCIIEHINTEPAEMARTRAWVGKQLRQVP